MMKFLTVFFVLLYGWRIINQNKTYREIIKEKLVGVKDQDLKEVLNKGIKDNDGDIVMLMLMTFWLIAITIIEGFYMLFAFKYGNPNVVLAYIIFWVIILLVKKIRSSIKTKMNKAITDKMTKYSIKGMLINIIDLAFFVYMFIQIFLK